MSDKPAKRSDIGRWIHLFKVCRRPAVCAPAASRGRQRRRQVADVLADLSIYAINEKIGLMHDCLNDRQALIQEMRCVTSFAKNRSDSAYFKDQRTESIDGCTDGSTQKYVAGLPPLSCDVDAQIALLDFANGYRGSTQEIRQRLSLETCRADQ